MFMITRTRRGWLALATMLALALTSACSASNPDRADTVSVSTNDNEAEPAADETVGQVEEQIPDEDGEAEQAAASESAAEPADEPPAEPLATVEGQPPFASLEITDLRRVGDTVTLEFVLSTPELDHRPSIRDYFAPPGVTLVDQVNRKRHLVLRDSEGDCLCTSFPEDRVDGDTRYPHSGQYPAPPADVEQMTVLVPGFPAIDNVPLRVAN